MEVLPSEIAAFVVVFVLGALARSARKDEIFMDEDSFTIKVPSSYVFLFVVGIVFYCGFILASNFVFAGQEGVWILQSFLAFFAIAALFGILYAIKWRIHVDGETITIVPLFGKPKSLNLYEISQVKFSGNNTVPQVKVYDLQGKKVFSLGSGVAG